MAARVGRRRGRPSLSGKCGAGSHTSWSFGLPVSAGVDKSGLAGPKNHTSPCHSGVLSPCIAPDDQTVYFLATRVRSVSWASYFYSDQARDE